MCALKYKAFYDMAVSDLDASILLLDNKYYCQALYFFEQAVEKQVKFLGLTTGWLSEDKVKKIGHAPISFFDKLFNNQIIKEFATVAKLDINDINDFGEYLLNMNVEDRVSIIKQSIAIADRYDSIKVPSGSNCSITLLKYYEDAKFNNEPEKAIKKAMETRDPTFVEAFCKREIELLNNFGK